jgi:hypothetical protein
MRAAFKEINKPKVTRRSQRLASPRDQPIDCGGAAKRSRQELTDILDKQKERIEIRRKESLERTTSSCQPEAPGLGLESIDSNIDMITSGLKTLTKKVSHGTVLPVHHARNQSKSTRSSGVSLEPIPPIRPLQRDPQRRGFGVSRRPVTSPPPKK